MSPSPESRAIQTPLSIVAELYARQHSSRHQQEDFFSSVSSHFSSVLSGHASQIPRLEDTSAQGRLVRFRCMVQDTGLANEVYALDTGRAGAGADESGAGCCAYSEGAIDGPPVQDHGAIDYSKLRERQVVYATSVPGETDWYRASRDQPDAASSPTTDNDASLADDLRARLRVDSSSDTPASLASKYPFPSEPHSGALVKLYPTAGEEQHLRTTEIVEFVGVLDYSAFPTAVEDAPSGSQENIKTLHAIFRLPIDAQPAASTPLERTDREDLIAYLAEGLGGDSLAAEWLLLSLLGSIHARRGALALGQLPINLVLPPWFPSDSIVSLRAALSTVLPRFVALSLTIPSLNASPFFPRSVDESLQSGALQLPAGTAVLVDESALGEGTLKDAGVRNVHALTKVINEQTLGYVFPFSSFEFETDLKVVVLSRGKSLLPVECIVPVVPATTPSAARQPSSAQLAAWRALFLAHSSGTTPRTEPESVFELTPAMSDFIQSDFVERRQRKELDQDDLVRRMTVARLLCLSLGRRELGKEEWEMTRVLDQRRKERILLPA